MQGSQVVAGGGETDGYMSEYEEAKEEEKEKKRVKLELIVSPSATSRGVGAPLAARATTTQNDDKRAAEAVEETEGKTDGEEEEEEVGREVEAKLVDMNWARPSLRRAAHSNSSSSSNTLINTATMPALPTPRHGATSDHLTPLGGCPGSHLTAARRNVASLSRSAHSPPVQEDDDIDDDADGDNSARGLTGTSIVSRAAAQGLWGEEGSAAADPDSIMEVEPIRIWNMAPSSHPGLDAVLDPYSLASMHAYAPLENMNMDPDLGINSLERMHNKIWK